MALTDHIIPERTRTLYRRLLLDGAREHWVGYAVGIGLLFIVSGATAAMAYIMKDVINELFVERRQEMIQWIAFLVMGIFVVRGLATYGNAMILARIGNKIIAKLQRRMFRHLLAQGAEYYDTHSIGDVVVRFSNNVGSARAAIDLLILSVGRDLVSLLALVGVMVVQNGTMSLVAVVVAPPAVIAVGWLTQRVKRIARQAIDANARIISRVREGYQGGRVIKAFNLEDHMIEGMDREITEVRGLSDKAVKYATLTVPMMDLAGGFAVGAVIAFAGWRIASGADDPGAFFSFLTALLLAYEPARRLARFQVQLQAHLVGVELMYEFLDRPAQEAPADRPKLAVTEGQIAFQKVSFAYGEASAVEDLSLICPGGKVTALVGASGAGKTTVFELIERLREAQAGQILIDGQDIAALDLADLRRHIALVNQQNFLFAGTLRENIRLGRLDASDAEIEAAAKAANAHEFIMEHADGYDRVMGDEAGLSGGERQRLAIARAMLREAPILLLDEATSALDAASEARVNEALGRLMQGRTTLVIAHRLATVRDADQICVLDRGRLIEQGTHRDLIAQKGAYARLHALQFAD
ncbi:MAG: ABC transporter transmembrane domain-containing protein [Pseudomonadota bacterium]